ncbi:MAG: hypothetical protein RIB98_14560 [Acidimicrobiales bacterium]
MAEPLKNQFDRALVTHLGTRFRSVHPTFDPVAFADTLVAAFPLLELKDRINLIADELRAALPDDYPTALELVVAVAETDGTEGFTAWPLCSFVERHGLVDPPASLVAMPRLTRRFSCEFAVRPFLEHHLALTLAAMRVWVRSSDEAVRRLPSEGTRPYLPWGPKVQALLDDPEIGIELLHALRHDPSETVRRSVANHLNDIARNHPARVVEICEHWQAEPATDPTMIRHALRSLVKKGNAGALAVLGFTTDPEVEVDDFAVSPERLSLGESIQLTASLTSRAGAHQRLVVDFVIHHPAAKGTTSPKVFKWTTIELAPGQSAQLTKSRRIATASTRRYHAGPHVVELQVAGRVLAATSFELLDSSE